MINDVRNSTGFANFAAAKKLKTRAPYSSRFQPLKAEVEAVGKADMIEPYSVEQSLRAFDEEPEDAKGTEFENLADADARHSALNEDLANIKPSEQSQLYSSAGPQASKDVLNSEPTEQEQLDDKAIVDTVVSNIADKIDNAFSVLECDLASAIEMRLGQALLGVFKRQLADETSERLKQSIAMIIAERGDAKVNISGPSELIELFQSHTADEENDKAKLSFSVDQSSADLIVQIDDISITSRFAELDNLVSELFE